MSLVRKLKPDREITGVLFPLSLLPITGLAAIIFGLETGIMVLGVCMWVFALFYLYGYLRTWNTTQLIIAMEGGIFGMMFIVFEPHYGIYPVQRVEFRFAYMTILFFFGVVLISRTVTRKFKWRGREVFELAAEPVEEVGNGYTSRPRPVGKVDYSPDQIRDFARFCSRHLIALPYSNSKNITLVPIKMGQEFHRLLGFSGDYRDATWVNFDLEGEVSVHISQKDYLDYREPLAFDQLCTSLGQLFIDFFDLYVRGEEIRIIDRMDDLRLGIFS